MVKPADKDGGRNENMRNEEKILSMLDLIASEVKSLKETTVSKHEFQAFKDEMIAFKDDMSAFKESSEAKLQSIDQKINEQTELLEAQFDVLNERLFKQEAQVMILRKKEAL